MAYARVSTCLAVLPFLLTIACSDTGSESNSASASTSITASISATDATPTTGNATSGSASSGGVPTTGGVSDSAATSSTGGDPSRSSTGGGLKFDLPTPDGGSDTEGLCGCGNDLGFSYIWIANTNNSTLTKLNTQTMVEEGRYLTRQDSNGSPSRTSVSISGRGVVVANRNGGVTKVLARHEDCDENKNGVPGLQTSSGKDDVLAWDQDDCVAWHTPFPYNTQRPVAWMAGAINPATCLYENEKVWTGGCQVGIDQWVWVNRLNGDTGAIEESIQIVGFECSSLAPYGGAVDSKGNFWMTNLVPGQDRLSRVDAETLEVEVLTPPLTPYGMTVDTLGRPWLASWNKSGNASAARYDPVAATWAFANNHVAYVYSGIQEDAKGRMWMNYWTYDDAYTGGVMYIDRDTMEVSEPFEVNPCERRGMSIDLDGNVWSTAQGCNQAYRFNPDTKVITTYDQLDGPYTYSDMTGWALQNNTCNNPNG